MCQFDTYSYNINAEKIMKEQKHSRTPEWLKHQSTGVTLKPSSTCQSKEYGNSKNANLLPELENYFLSMCHK